MNYDEAVSYLLQIPKFCKKTGHDNLAVILDRLGNPQEKVKTVHIAGTNGKGSVCAFLHSILVDAGKRTGMFTSPHLVKVNERMRINGEMISDAEFLEIFQTIRQMVLACEQEGYAHPSFFEFLFLMTVVFFEKKQVEYAIFETGLGGRLDATNILKRPMVTVITSISLDHTEILGNTLEDIATEKAGIIKCGVPVVYRADLEGKIDEVICGRAKQMQAKCVPLSKEDVKIHEISSKYIDFSLQNRYYSCENIRVSFPAVYQAENCSLALLAFEVLKKQDISLQSIQNPQNFVKDTCWEGRMEEILPHIFVDGAHNLSGISSFLESVKAIRCGGKRRLLFSVVVEKDYKKMAALLLKGGLWDEIFVAKIENQRGLSGKDLLALFAKNTDVSCRLFSDVREAFFAARADMKEEDILYCAGSLYLVGELKNLLEERGIR